MLPEPLLFPELFATQPAVVRRFLRSALRITALDNLCREAGQTTGSSFCTAALGILRIGVDIAAADLARVPVSGPVIFVANHPHGFLDGLVLHHVLQRRRSDLKLLVNDRIARVEGMQANCIGVDVFAPEAERNAKPALAALRWLKSHHSLLVFPAGEVSHWHKENRRVADGPWSASVIRWALRVKASIVPVFLTGSNSLLFHAAGLLSPELRTAQLPSELLRKRHSRVEVRIARSITPAELERAGSAQNGTDYVRARVYLLGTRAPASVQRTPLRARFQPRPSSQPTPGVAAAIENLRSSCCLLENDRYAVFAERGLALGAILPEIGRLREVTFRDVGEGTGQARDLDAFDPHYTHLVLWHKPSASIAGAYRLAWTDDVLPRNGPTGLYTNKLFRYAPEFFDRLGPALELGRSFIVHEHQRDFLSLLSLWQGIGRCVAARASSPTLFGAVSISSSYSETARALIVDTLRQRSFREDLAGFVSPRRPCISPLLHHPELSAISRCLPDVEDLPIADIQAQGSVPVLLRQYLRLGGRVAAFNVDRHFSNALDALLILDLRETPAKLLTKYMGAAGAACMAAPATKA